MDLWMANADDDPHAADRELLGRTKCNQPLSGMTKVTEAQVMAFLDGRHCPRCFVGKGREQRG
jgi:hypothetical protein